MTQMTLREIRSKHPFPWAQAITGTGEVLVTDARGGVVPLFTITALCLLITSAPAPQAPAPQSEQQ